MKEQELSIRSLFEAGVHYGHQPGRWNPLMRSFIFGERNGTHILDLDQTLPLLEEALDFLRDSTAAGGSVLFVGTKRQAAAPIMTEALRSRQYYVNNRWLGGMLTNWKTVRKSIDRYNSNPEFVTWLKSQGFTQEQIGSHAAIRDSSELMAAHLEGVRMDKRSTAPLPDGTRAGGNGDPMKASVEIGKKGLELKIQAAITQLQELKQAAAPAK